MNPMIKFIEDCYPFREDPKLADTAVEKWIIRLSPKSIAGLNADLKAMDEMRKKGGDFREVRQWHKGTLRVEGKEYPCKLRWRGTYRHWKDDKNEQSTAPASPRKATTGCRGPLALR